MIWSNNLLFDLKKKYFDELKLQFGENEAYQLLNVLTKHFFDLSRIQQSLNPNHRLNESEMLSLHMAVKKLKKNIPIQYITGESEFRGMKFLVNDSVLIPRPETEELVELILNSEGENGLKVLDIGTGSGCIAIALAKEMNNSEVFALDISPEALRVAEENARFNNTNVTFIEGNILNYSHNNKGSFDIIVSNPPYVRVSEKSFMKANVLDYEPHLALFVEDKDPLKFYKAILEYAYVGLKTGGRLYFEINEKLGEDVANLLAIYNYSEILVRKDINDKQRIVSGKRR